MKNKEKAEWVLEIEEKRLKELEETLPLAPDDYKEYIEDQIQTVKLTIRILQSIIKLLSVGCIVIILLIISSYL